MIIGDLVKINLMSGVTQRLLARYSVRTKVGNQEPKTFWLGQKIQNHKDGF